jgi:hypothetical protein
MIRSCEDFERWLDDGRPGDGRPGDLEAAADAHAAGCGRCRAALAAARSVEEAISLPTATPAPADFTDVVMQRVRAAEAERAAERSDAREASALGLWLRLAAEPWIAVPCVLVALLAWRWSAFLAVAAKLTPTLALWADATGRALGTVTFELPTGLRAPGALLGLSMAAVPVILWASWQLARWSERAFAMPLVRAPRHR